MDIFIKLLVSYLIGSVSGSMVMGKIKHVDIRTMGSGNAGGTNAFRTMGAFFALGVIIIDIAKGFIPTKFVSNMQIIESTSVSPDLLAILCGVVAVIGHVFPIYHGFKGGKGGGAGIGLVLAIHPMAMVVALTVWIINLILTGWVGLGTMLAAISIAIYGYLVPCENIYFLNTAIAIAIFIIYTHRSNIQRMLSGNENQFEKAMIFHKLFKK
jgi:glycerol-3-phosphate acyltransferase PlsY